MDGTYSRDGKINAYNFLVGKPEGRRPLGRPAIGVKLHFKEMGCDSVD
jgi:hypothetical protein